MGAILWPWGVLLLWPAIALGIVAIAYSERARSFFTRLKESCRGARDLCWRLV
jgi:hypothetical protein